MNHNIFQYILAVITLSLLLQGGRTPEKGVDAKTITQRIQVERSNNTVKDPAENSAYAPGAVVRLFGPAKYKIIVKFSDHKKDNQQRNQDNEFIRFRAYISADSSWKSYGAFISNHSDQKQQDFDLKQPTVFFFTIWRLSAHNLAKGGNTCNFDKFKKNPANVELSFSDGHVVTIIPLNR